MIPTDKRKRSEKRQPINRLVAPETVRLLKALAESLQLSEGRVIDRAVAALAVAESFGAQHLKLSDTDANKLAESQEMARKLREQGFEPKGYTLPAPHERRRATTLDATGIDRDSKRGKATEEAQHLRLDETAKPAKPSSISGWVIASGGKK